MRVATLKSQYLLIVGTKLFTVNQNVEYKCFHCAFNIFHIFPVYNDSNFWVSCKIYTNISNNAVCLSQIYTYIINGLGNLQFREILPDNFPATHWLKFVFWTQLANIIARARQKYGYRDNIKQLSNLKFYWLSSIWIKTTSAPVTVIVTLSVDIEAFGICHSSDNVYKSTTISCREVYRNGHI